MSRYEDILVLKDKVSATLDKINGKMQKLTKSTSKTSKAIAGLQRSSVALKNFGKSAIDLGNKLNIGLTLPIVGVGTAMAKAGMEFQDAEIALQTMLGSAEKGSKLFKDIVDMGAKTPFQSKDLLQASKLMLNFGISEKKVIPYMKQLGDISGGNSERFQSLALAFSQVSSAGKLQGQDLLQMINAGFNPLQVISEKTGKSMAKLRDEMSKGKISFNMVTQAMEYATGKGGRFENMMDKMSKTASGKLSTMLDNLNIALAKMGQVMLPYVTKGIEALTAVFEKFANLSPAMQKFLIIAGAVLASIGPMITLIGGLATAIGVLNGAFAFLLANPVVLWIGGITLAIAGLVIAIKKLVGWWKKLRGVQDNGINAQIAKGVYSSPANYRQNNVTNTNTSNVTNNNYYGNNSTPYMSPMSMLNNNMSRIPVGA